MAWSLWSPKSNQYSYPSLRSKPRVFRVIKLLPPIRSWLPPYRETLNIEILEADVDSATGQYETLSYSWGDSPIDRTVIVSRFDNGKRNLEHTTIRISASLELALLSLAHDGDIETRRPIFADQICINQASDAEKIQQVGLMGLIYSRSAATIVWLGAPTAETNYCLDFSCEINGEGVLSRVMGPNVSHYMDVFDAVMDPSRDLQTEAQREDRDDLLDLIARYGPRFPLRGLVEVLCRAWHTRLWTVQEGCLPARLIFRCGEKSQCYDCLRGLLLFYSMWNNYWLEMPKEPVSKEEIAMRREIFTLNKPFLRLVTERRMLHVTQSPRKALYDLVLRYNVNDNAPKIGATRAEDRIYALLGLARSDEITREIIENMEVDNVKGSYTRFAASVIKANEDLLLFSQWPKSKEHGDQLHSWVPDWSMDPLRTPYGYSDLMKPMYSAGGDGHGDSIVADVSAGVLRLSAISVGKVVRVGVHGIEREEDATVEKVEYMSVRGFFEEISEFIELAAAITSMHDPDISDEQRRLEAVIRLSDGGLSTRQFPAQFDPVPAILTLKRIHIAISEWGKRLRDVKAQTRLMSSFTGMVRSTGIMPWYWTPASEIDVVRSCATDPIAAAWTWIQGLLFTTSDIICVTWFVAKLRLHTASIRYRRARAKLDLHHPDHKTALENVGLPSDLINTDEWELYTSNLFKNIGRRLFLTDTGRVGLGPSQMKPGDSIVVIPGSTVPHVLQRQTKLDSLDDGSGGHNAPSWSYVGEAYCDGVMDGELVTGQGNEPQVFVVV
ncbi:heterokaryon incompatibility protein-domain-containing protein [Xylaria arbuscula]|nr:heterokaryon incompatibility protein-domain-containing protein [Xylaria arbuscula]